MSAPVAFVVIGAAVVLPQKSGGERYLYRSDAEIPAAGYTEKGLRHAESVGLVRIIEGEQPKRRSSTPTPQAD